MEQRRPPPWVIRPSRPSLHPSCYCACQIERAWEALKGEPGLDYFRGPLRGWAGIIASLSRVLLRGSRFPTCVELSPLGATATSNLSYRARGLPEHHFGDSLATACRGFPDAPLACATCTRTDILGLVALGRPQAAVLASNDADQKERAGVRLQSHRSVSLPATIDAASTVRHLAWPSVSSDYV